MSDDTWEANSIRLTLFPKEPLDLSADFWRPIFESEPDVEETRAKEGLKRQVGPWTNGIAEVQANPARLDVFIGPAPTEPVLGQPILPSLTIGPMLDQIDLFARTISAWLSNLPFEVNRIAVSGCAMAESETGEGTYEILQRHIRSVNVKPGAMRELLYRVNWQRPSSFTGYYNNLQTWGSLIFATQAVVLGNMPAVRLSHKNFAQLQFDVNTPADRQEPLEHGTLVPILEDLLALVREGVTYGEQPLDA